MDIINTKIEDILKFPFKDKDSLNTFGVYAIINFLNSVIIAIAFIFFFFGTPFVLDSFKTGILFTALFSILFAIFFFVQLYLQGYLVEMIRKIKNGEDEKPKHNEFDSKLKLGFATFVLSIGPIAISILFILLSAGVIFLGIFNLETASTLGIILILIGSLITFIFSLILSFVVMMVIPAMLYIYLQTNSIYKAYNFKKISIVIKSMWREFLILYVVSLLLSIAISTLGQIPCIGFLVIALGTSYMAFVISFLTGKIFADLDKLKLVK